MKNIFLLLILFSLVTKAQVTSNEKLDSSQEFYRERGDEPWKTFDKKNIGGSLISIGWGVTVITFLAAPPTKLNKVIAYGVGGSITTSGLLYWVIKGHKYKKKKDAFKI